MSKTKAKKRASTADEVWTPKRAVIITVGGNALPLNQLILSAREYALKAGVDQVYGVFRGYVGLMSVDFKRARKERANYVNITTGYPYSARGGTFLRCYRGSPCRDSGRRDVDPKLASRLVGNLNHLKANILIVIGGNGTAAATAKLDEYLRTTHKGKFLVIFLPRTIDNDIGFKDEHGHTKEILCPGYPSAVSNVSRVAEDIIVEAEATERIYLVQTQGRDSGWVAAAGARGRAQHQLIPECFEEVKTRDVVKLVETTRDQDGYAVVTVSEGLKKDPSKGSKKSNYLGQTGPGRAVRNTADSIQDSFIKFGGPPPLPHKPSEARRDYVKVHHSDYDPRTGSPSRYDLQLAELEASFVEKIIKECKGCKKGQVPDRTVPVLPLGKVVRWDDLGDHCFTRVRLDSLVSTNVPDGYLDKDNFRCNAAFRDLLYTITSGPERAGG